MSLSTSVMVIPYQRESLSSFLGALRNEKDGKGGIIHLRLGRVYCSAEYRDRKMRATIPGNEEIGSAIT